MATIAKLDVLLGLEDGAFQRGLESSRQKLDKWGSNLRSMGTKLTAGVTAPIAGSGIAMVKWAADLEQTMGATEQLWGDNADEIIAWSETANTSMGLTQDEALTSANRFNAMFKQMDTDRGTIKDMSQDFTQLSADLSAMWGGSSIEASDALTSALRGNYESMDKYNINLTEAMVNQEAMNIALADGRDEITEGDKVQARYNLIMEQSADAQGQFARETDTTSGKLAILRARVIDAATRFGKLLLPYVNKAADAVSKFVGWIEGLNDTQRKWVLGIAAVAAAIGPLLLVIGMLLPGLSALLAVIGFLVSPIGLIVIAIAALVAGLVWAYFEFEAFREIVDSVASTIRDVAVAAFEKLVEVFNKLKDAFESGGFSEMFSTLGEMALNGMRILLSAIQNGISWVAQQFVQGASNLLSAGMTWLQGLWDGAVSKWNEVTVWLGGLASDAATWVGDTLSSLAQKGTDLISGLWTAATTKWTEVTTWFSGLGTEVVTAIGDLLLTLSQKGTDLIQGMYTAITVGWTTVSAWFVSLPSLVTTAVGDVLTTLSQKGTDILQGFWDGVLSKWVAVSTWFVSLASMVIGAVADVTTTLKSKGTDILQGFWQGVLDKWIAVSTWFLSLGSMIVGAVGDIGSSLYDAGVAIMNGLWQGLKDTWGSVTSWLSGLNPADWKGPERRDKKMLYEPGIWIMEGLQRGLAEGWDDVTRQLSGYTPSISGGLSAGGIDGIGGTPIIQIITLEPGKWQEFLADAQQGGKFARNFGSELGMVGGDI